MVYKFKNGFQSKGCDPQAVGVELERIREQGGGEVDLDTVVSIASDPESPMHPAFTWDDSEAAFAYRLIEAKKLVTAVVVVKERGQKAPSTAFAKVRVSHRDSGSSARRVAALTGEDSYSANLRIFVTALNGFDTRLRDIYPTAPAEDRDKIRLAIAHVAKANEIVRGLQKR